jgi:prepilin-type N-terminal cleavage/methylation domain-containing protein
MPCRTSQGFSLVEMLVVVAIVGLLAGMLMPAVNMYRDRMKEATSLLTIKTLDGACKYFHLDLTYYPPSKIDDAVDPKRLWHGYRLLPWFLTGYADVANDGKEGFGFRTEKRGKVCGPYNDAEKLTVQKDDPKDDTEAPYFIDSFGQPIFYYRMKYPPPPAPPPDPEYEADHNPPTTGSPNDINAYAQKKSSTDYYRYDFILLSKGSATVWHDDAIDKNITNFQIHK